MSIANSRWTGQILLLIAAAAISHRTSRAELVSPQQIDQVSLRHAEIRVAPNQPRYVLRAIDDLREMIRQCTGRTPMVITLDGTDRTSEGPIIEVGLTPWKTLSNTIPDPEHFWPETYLLSGTIGRGEGDKPVISVASGDPQGLKYGVIRLISLLRLQTQDVTLRLPLREVGVPAMAIRGMYGHLHWSYHRPYALRAWQIDDWKRYVDLLTHFGFNRLQIWPMMELLPHPLSPDDGAYLRQFADIIEYAHRERGIQVVVGSCPNNITEDARAVPIAQREYFDFEKRLNPGDPVQLKRILDHRSDLYRTLPSADGYWVIDSDPGGWKGSPSSQFVDILIGHRKLIDTLCARPKEQPLIYWMWYGWGTGTQPENWKATLTDMKKRLPEPWRLCACTPEHLAVCREMNLLDRTLYYPYNTLETEPGGPLTDLRFDRIAKEVKIAREAGLTGIQGNTQTPLVQIPNIACLAQATWHTDTAVTDQMFLSELAGRLLSRDADVLAKAWHSLGQADGPNSLELADKLRHLAQDPTAAGTLAVVLGDWQSRVLEDLASMLEIQAAAVRFAQAAATPAAPESLIEPLASFIIFGGKWLDRTGYHNRDPITHDAYRKPVADALSQLSEKTGRDAVTQRIVKPAIAAAEQGCRPEMCGLVIESVYPKFQ